MRRNYLVFVFLSMCSISMYCDQYSQYKFEKVATILVGNDKGMIGWQTPVAGGPSSPLSFAFRKDRYYIPDIVNKRFYVYDKNGKYISEIIDNKKLIHVSSLLLIDDHMNIYGLITNYGIVKININNNRNIYFIDWDKLPKSLSEGHELFIVNDETFFYYDNYEVGSFSKTGVLENTERTIKKLYNLQHAHNKVNEEMEIDYFRNKILIGENYYTSSMKSFKEFINHQNEEKYKKINDILYKKNLSVDLRDYFIELIGYDDNHNSYWAAEQNTKFGAGANFCIIIFSKYGEFLDAIIYGQSILEKNAIIVPNIEKFPTSWSHVTVDRNGDLYFLCEPKIDYSIDNTDKLPTIDSKYYSKQNQKPSYVIYRIKCIWNE